MAVDLEGLRRIADGDDATKVAVSRKWLREVYKELTELERRRNHDAAYKRTGSFLDQMFGKGGK